MTTVFTFAVNLLCAYVSCLKIKELPSDPLSAHVSVRHAPTIENDNLTVMINTGAVEGYKMKSIRGRTIYAFEGIPFGETTGGENRFEPPLPKRPWSGILETKKPGDFCVQLHLIRFYIFGSEDCLYLNVYTPEHPSNKKNLPVIIFIHGGAYFFGSGSEYGPSYMLEQDIILVTINYRLGILGFLSTGDKYLPGNNGLKDQALAFKWVYENIEQFGGDPSLITIMGQSSGAASVHMHMISEVTRPYFSGAISLSGTAFTSWSIANRKYADDIVEKVGNLTGCEIKNSLKFVKCLKKMNSYFLAGKIGQLFAVPGIPSAPLAPVIEPQSSTAFLTKHPDQVYREGGVAKIPWISSGTGDEGHLPLLIMTAFRLEWLVKRLWDDGAPTAMDYKFVAKNPKEITNSINQFYFGTDKVRKLEDVRAFGDLFTDRWFAYALHKALQAHSSVAPTFSHLLRFRGTHGLVEYLGLDKKDFGVGHIDDLPYLFNMSTFFPGYKTTDQEYAVIKLMTGLISNFAKWRTPLYTSPDGVQHKIWNEIKDPRDIQVLEIADEVKMIPEPNEKRLRFWETLELSDMVPWLRYQ